MALLAGGGYAEEVVAPEPCVMVAPACFTNPEAGAFAEVFVTAYLNLFEVGGLSPSGAALVHGGSGGVGTAAIQLGREAGARVLVTAGGPERCRRCVELGAELAFDHRRDDLDLVQSVLDATAGSGVDVVLDCVGAPYLEAHLRLLATDGSLVIIGLMGGADGEIDLRRLLARRLSLIGSTLRSRPVAEKGRIVASMLARFGAAVSAGRLRPVVDRVFPLDDVAEAHRRLAGGAVFGKLVLSLEASRRS